ncbi:MAG: hypothetical protein M0P69_13550 [Bacteroidales bacterium]|jgi:hypothetical protein|nr:hypothetical protein [Bacteroidales bacterium]
MLNIGTGIKLSAIIDKMDLKIDNPDGSRAEVGAELVVKVISKAHKAEKEIYNLVAEVKGCSIEEAPNVDLINFIGELFDSPDVVNFLKSAVK